MFSKGKTWVINGSNENFLAIKSATSVGTESLLLKPEKKMTSLLDAVSGKRIGEETFRMELK